MNREIMYGFILYSDRSQKNTGPGIFSDKPKSQKASLTFPRLQTVSLCSFGCPELKLTEIYLPLPPEGLKAYATTASLRFLKIPPTLPTPHF